MSGPSDNGSEIPGLPLAVSMGEPAGVGPELLLDCWLQRLALQLPPFFVAGSAGVLEKRAAMLGKQVPLQRCAPQDALAVFADAMPVADDGAAIAGKAGVPAPQDGKAITGWIRQAVESVHKGDAAAVVTAPINKQALYQAGFSFPGHTEFLAALAGEFWGTPATPVMMLAGPQLRTVPVTIHIPLARVAQALTSEAILETLRITDRDLRQRFAIEKPRLAVSGLNPHAGEGGSLGSEDDAIIRPAIEAAQAEGISAFGPLPADTLFHARARLAHDAVICMYHDQALIPAKTLAFDETVNVTLGLPFVRTSPDHGTALDIAGKGIANPASMTAAIRLAHALSGGRRADGAEAA